MHRDTIHRINGNDYTADNRMKRREFINTVSKAAGGIALTSIPFIAEAHNLTNATQPTVGNIMDLFIKKVPGAPFTDTVDTLKAGNRDIKVTGVVTTMFATVAVIRKTIDLGANFIIAHEPTFYNHRDEVDWLQEDDVYKYKMILLQQHNIAVWRNHDYIHSLTADGVYAGVLDQLEWKQYSTGNNILQVPGIKLRSLIDHVKNKLGIQQVRYIGDLNQLCPKILLMPGAAGGRAQISAISKNKPDVLVCGEIQEWETAEYVRDARAEGRSLALVVLGHIASEEPGSIFMANWIKNNIPSITVTHVTPGNSLSFA